MEMGAEKAHTYGLVSDVVAGGPFANAGGSLRPRPCRWHAVAVTRVSSGSYICVMARRLAAGPTRSSEPLCSNLRASIGPTVEGYNTIASAGRFGAGGGAALSRGSEEGGADDGRARWTEGGAGVARGHRRTAEQVEKGPCRHFIEHALSAVASSY
jgi:hypothetical protein